MTNFFMAANDRKKSMWQLASEATNASSGSTAFGFDNGSFTTCGEEEAGTVTPPSNSHWCARLYLLSEKTSLGCRAHFTVAVYSAISSKLFCTCAGPHPRASYADAFPL